MPASTPAAALTLPWPSDLPRSRHYRVTADGDTMDVLHSRGAELLVLQADREITLAVEAIDMPCPTLRTHTRGPERSTVGSVEGRATLTVRPGDKVLIEPEGARSIENGYPPLVVVAVSVHAVERTAPASPDIDVKPGEVHDVGELTLTDGQSLHVAPGGVVRGLIRVEGDDVWIGGGGMLDADYRQRRSAKDGGPVFGGGRPLIADGASRVTIDGLILINPAKWMVTFGGCRDVEIRDVVLLGKGYSTDGINVVGSERVRASDGLIVCDDDCLVTKSMAGYEGSCRRSVWTGSVGDVRFDRFLVGSGLAGSAMEIGHEVHGDVRDVIYTDIDVAYVHQHGSVFGIHQADGGSIDDIRYRRVRIDQCFDKCIDFRVFESRWSSDDHRGRIGHIRLEDCDWWTRGYNAGHTANLIGGHDAERPVGQIEIDNFRIDGRPVQSADDLELLTRHTPDVQVR